MHFFAMTFMTFCLSSDGNFVLIAVSGTTQTVTWSGKQKSLEIYPMSRLATEKVSSAFAPREPSHHGSE